MKKYSWLIFIPLVIVLVSCIKQKEISRIEFTYSDHNYKHGPCDTVNYECVDINIRTIEINGAPNQTVRDSVEAKVKGFVLAPTVGETSYNSFYELRDSLIENYKSIRKEIPEMKIGYELKRNVKVETDTLGIFAMEYYEFFFYGGAHPNYSTTYSNIDISNGCEIKLDGLLTTGYENKLNFAAEIIFRETKNISSSTSLEKEGYWFESGKFKINDNFIITKNGLKFFFNSYEIAPYSFGTTELIIPYSKITELIKKNGLLGRFIGS